MLPIKMVNFGNIFEHFFEACQELSDLGYDINFKFPRMFSENNFAHYERLVYGSFREDYAGLVKTLRDIVDNLKDSLSMSILK